MRVVAKESFKTYFQMVCIDVNQGDEFEGDFADFLVAGGAPVEPAGAAEPSESEQPPDDPPSDPTPDDGSDGDRGDAPDDELDISGTANDVLEWVGDDPRRAAEARAAESAKDKPRSTLLAKLDAIAGP